MPAKFVSHRTKQFRELFDELPADIQELARAAFS